MASKYTMAWNDVLYSILQCTFIDCIQIFIHVKQNAIKTIKFSALMKVDITIIISKQQKYILIANKMRLNGCFLLKMYFIIIIFG